jgi:hypothetical protein
MFLGLLAKSFREVRWQILGMCLALGAVMGLLTFVLPQIQNGLGDILDKLPFAKSMLSALLGTELGDEFSSRAMQAFLWTHPVVLALTWAHEIVLCTRVPAGEIDRGTIDTLLGLPVSRRAVFLSEAVIWSASGFLMLATGYLGHVLASPAMPPDMRPGPKLAATILTNLYCVYLAVGGIAFLASAISNRRGLAMGEVFALVLASFLLNFLAQFWPPAKKVAFLSVMEYYRPAQIVIQGQFPVGDVAVLLAVAALMLVVASEVFARRNIATT